MRKQEEEQGRGRREEEGGEEEGEEEGGQEEQEYVNISVTGGTDVASMNPQTRSTFRNERCY